MNALGIRRPAARGAGGRIGFGWGLALVAMLGLAPVASGLPPLPSFRYYGMLLNEYGWPVIQDDNTVLVLRVGTNECARFTANELLGHGINYVLEAPMDYAARARYARYAARRGDAAAISVWVGSVQQSLMNTSAVPPVGNPGDAVRLDLNIGTDADHDGLSDLWEEMLIIYNSNGRYTDITQVLPEDDFDGDGASNGEEYLAGTAPEFANDIFKIRDWMRTSNGQVVLSFMPKYGTTYRLYSASADTPGPDLKWSRSAFRTAPTASAQLDYTAGHETWMIFYVEPMTNAQLFRLEVVK